ncbi:MAG: MATE family efflux transporter [Oscillospiraceae bacterium]
MGVMPVKKLVVTMSWPIMLSMLVQALYNMVDGIFVSWASDKAFLALGYAFPAQSLMIAICAGTGVGVNALLARRLGEKNTEEASQVALHSYLIYFAIRLALAAFGLLAAKPFIGLYTTDPEVLRYGTDYLRIVTIGSIGMCMQFSAERILQASGNSIGPMIIQGAGALFNIIFDPILIFGYFGFPAMGVAGAAIATIAGQWLGMVIGFVMVLRNKIVPIHPRAFRFHGHLIVDIYRIGLPAILMQSLATVAVSIMNKFLGSISDAHMFVITAYIKIESFVLMPIFGLNNGVIPIISYNYGARKPDRIREAIRFSLALSMVIMCLGTLLFWLFPQLFLSLFNAPADAVQVGIIALRTISLSFPMAAIAIVLSGVFQALDAPILSLISSLTRTILSLVPIAALFTYLYPDGVWFSYPISQALCVILSVIFYKKIAKQRLHALSA